MSGPDRCATCFESIEAPWFDCKCGKAQGDKLKEFMTGFAPEWWAEKDAEIAKLRAENERLRVESARADVLCAENTQLHAENERLRDKAMRYDLLMAPTGEPEVLRLTSEPITQRPAKWQSALNGKVLIRVDEPPSADAVDPQVTSTGKPSTREKASD